MNSRGDVVTLGRHEVRRKLSKGVRIESCPWLELEVELHVMVMLDREGIAD